MDILPMPVKAMAGIAAVRGLETVRERRMRLLGEIARQHSVSVADMLSMRQTPAVVMARREAMAELRFALDVRTYEIAELFGRTPEAVHYNLRHWFGRREARPC